MEDAEAGDGPRVEAAAAAREKKDEVTVQALQILKNSHESEFLQSFLRVDLGTDSDPDTGGGGGGGGSGGGRKKLPAIPSLAPPRGDDAASAEAAGPRRRAARPRPSTPPPPPDHIPGSKKVSTFQQLAKEIKMKKNAKPGKTRRSRGRPQEEIYTDKDRAAAVNMGTRDIKQSLKMKRRQDRSKALQIPEEAKPGALLALGSYEMRCGNLNIAINFVHKALELNPRDKNALVARSKCYLLLGEPQLALEDAETVLQVDKNFVRAIFQKAEALYNMGDFEHSLMFYHRGLRLRPELDVFRLGVQKTQQAIQNTIGQALTGAPSKGMVQAEMTASSSEKDSSLRSSRSRPNSSSSNKSSSRQLLGELCIDKAYLEQLLKNPDIKCLHQNVKNQIESQAEEGIAFLNTRQEFWRQQYPINIAEALKNRGQQL